MTVMSKSPAHTISDFLSTNGLGSVDPTTTTPNWKVMTGRQTDKPDQQITVYDSGGIADNPAWRLNYPSLQIRVRGVSDDYPGAWAKINDIKEFLVGLNPQDIEGNHWSGIIMQGGIISIGYDSESRPEFTVNLKCFVEPSQDSSTYMHRESL